MNGTNIIYFMLCVMVLVKKKLKKLLLTHSLFAKGEVVFILLTGRLWMAGMSYRFLNIKVTGQ